MIRLSKKAWINPKNVIAIHRKIINFVEKFSLQRKQQEKKLRLNIFITKPRELSLVKLFAFHTQNII